MIRNQKIRCSFETERLMVVQLNEVIDLNALADRTKLILSTEVTRALPPGWQSIDSKEKAIRWIKERDAESTFLLVKSKLNTHVIGFIFLYTDDLSAEDELTIRFGYLLAKESWGKGIGTEVLNGFIAWAKSNGSIKSISGGVEKSNIGSIKVLEKVGFTKLESDSVETDFYEYKFK